MVNINWNNIRAIDGQREGFEELVCQLAGQEIISKQQKFIRIGKPDAGKECYWQLNNGKIHCWQAKYFINSLTDSQWLQVEKSVKTAIDNHPSLEKYYVAIPVDRPDGKARGKSMLQKWNEHVAEWEKYASSKNMKVSFEYWGKHELEIRLRKPENEGLIHYFFNESEFTDSWFNSKNQDSIDALGGRYTPELNFNLPFLSFIDGFSRDINFVNQFNGYYEKVLEKYRATHLKGEKEELKNKISALNSTVDILKEIYKGLTFSGVKAIPFENIEKGLDEIAAIIKDISTQLYKWRDEHEKAQEAKGEKIDYYSRPFNNELHDLGELQNAINDFYSFLNSTVCALANNPYLILVGPAGIGKSHTLADIVEERYKNGKISLLLLGENFSTNEMPWTQILNNFLHNKESEDVFLGALNTKAESQQNRIILIVDALNEGNGRLVWPKKLKAFIRSFHRYPWLGLIVSIRNTFEDLIAPKNEVDASIASRIYHPGFEGVEHEASIHFFNHYKIIPPGSPLLHPEFQNPLFLKLFCEGLAKNGLRQIPEGYQGISTIIEYYIEGVENKLSQPNELDYDVKLKLLRKAIDEILTKMVENNKDHLPYQIGDEITSNTFSGKCRSDNRQYLKQVISEGVINEDLYWENDKHYDGIHFAYQRFQDHLIVSTLLDKYLDNDNPEKSFASGPLKDLLEKESEAYYHQNIVEALSIQVPERVGKELHEVAPYAAEYYSTATAFIDGLIWRRTDTVGESSINYINQVLAKKGDLIFEFFDTVISLSTKSNFYFNADWLHKNLFSQTLSERDTWWTTWLQDKYGEHSDYNSVKRLISWAWDDYSKEDVDDESIRLASIALGWFLTSSNRYLRDGATKALICILQDRILVLIQVLQQFEGVNDPYIYERLYAVAYGCALRTANQQSLVELSEYIYKTVFDTDKVYPHILLRDYARGVIEYTIYIDLKPKIEVEKVRPPYKSDFPDKLPTIKEIDAKYNPKGQEGHYGGKNWGATAILNSMTTEYGRGTAGYGDFGRYTFQSALSKWDVNYDGLSNYTIQRIFELGYDPKVFSSFDSSQGSGRGTGHKERIGKKYQWIAFYEVLARVSDNCKMFDESSYSWSDKKKYTNYEGPWNPYVRDIDPTMTIKGTHKERDLSKTDTAPWWVPCQYQNWAEGNEHWQRNPNDFPKILDLLVVKDSKGVEWVNLNINIDWMEPKKVGEDRWEYNGKRIWYNIGSWLVTPKELRNMLKVDNTENVTRKWLPDISSRYEVFSREYYWAPASSFFQVNSYYGGDTLPIGLEDKKSGKQIAIANNTTTYFLWETEFDCSKENAIAYHKPTPLISFGLKPSLKEGEYLNEQNEVVCLDPSVYENGPTCLLIRKDHMKKFLKESGLNLVWIIQGEKQILGNKSEQLPRFEHKIGGLYYMNDNENIDGEMKNYIRNYDN